jgi:outer membrane protein assembly factor BamB
VRLAVVLLVLAPFVRAQETRPLHNTSFVPTDDEKIRQLIEEARTAARRDDAEAAAGLLQRVLLTKSDAVVALRGRELYTSPRRWAQLALLAEREPFRRPVLEAWRKVHDARASGALLGAMAAGDRDEMLRLLDRFPAATAAPAAVLALCDAAVQRGNPDAAQGYLLLAPEHLARSEAKAFLASGPYRARAEFLRNRVTRAPVGWPTVGGSAGRARNGDALPAAEKLELKWASTPFLAHEPSLVDYDQPTRASSTIPFYPICDEKRIYVHLGTTVAMLDRGSGKLIDFAPVGKHVPDPALIGTMMLANPGLRGATIKDGVLYFARLRWDRHEDEFHSYNELIAFDVAGKQRLWTRSLLRPRTEDPTVLHRPIFFRGAPAVVGSRLYVYGAIREKGDSGATRKEEAHLFCFEAKSGDLVWHRFLGYSDTEVAPTLPPISGHAPAVGRGVVVAVTGLGVAAGLDARSGEILWLLRYSRRPMADQPRLRAIRERWAPRHPGWKREPPRIVGDYVLFAPADGETIDRCWLRGQRRPQDGTYTLVCWSQRRDRDLGRNCLLEYVAGFLDGRGYYVGVRDPDRERWGYENVVSNDLEHEYPFRYARLPATLREAGRAVGVPPPLFGRPTIAGKVLLLPTRRSLYSFDLSRGPDAKGERAGGSHEIPPLGRLDGPELEHAKRDPAPPAFGNIISIGGRLYAVTRDRVLCYGAKD